MQNSVEFVEKIWEDNQVLFKAMQMQIRAFYDAKPTMDKLRKNFIRRMVNERMNLNEIMKSVVNSDLDTDPIELVSLCKQALDEANHYRMVRDAIEYMTSEPLDLADVVPTELADLTTKGARVAERFNVEHDPIARGLYQMIVEGNASCNWQVMADNLTDPVLSFSYAKIAADERFHAKLGRTHLAKILDTEEKQNYASELATKMRKDLFNLNCAGNIPIKESREMIENHYGKEWITADFNTVALEEIY